MLEVHSRETGATITALALNLEEDNIGAVVLGDYLQLKEGDEVRRTGRVLEVPVGPSLIGRVAISRNLSPRSKTVVTSAADSGAMPRMCRWVKALMPGVLVARPGPAHHAPPASRAPTNRSADW